MTYTFFIQRQYICELLGLADSNIFYENLKTRATERGGSEGVAALESLGLLDDKPVQKLGSPLDTLSHYLSKRLALGNTIIYFMQLLLFLSKMT